MKIYYADIESDKIDIETKFEFQESEGNYIVKSFKGNLFKSGDAYFLVGELLADYESTCDRCLEPVLVKLKTDISVGIEPGKIKNINRAEYEIQDDDADVYNTDPDFINLHEILRQELILQTPIKNVCSPICNLPEDEGSENELEMNTPLSGLAKLKDKLKEK